MNPTYNASLPMGQVKYTGFNYLLTYLTSALSHPGLDPTDENKNTKFVSKSVLMTSSDGYPIFEKNVLSSQLDGKDGGERIAIAIKAKEILAKLNIKNPTPAQLLKAQNDAEEAELNYQRRNVEHVRHSQSFRFRNCIDGEFYPHVSTLRASSLMSAGS